ncbi:hypothetical protein [Gordonia sp. YY1]|uniref:hypothetical protein n=1 Tax=Gordonia sp. YY1 TaxID=396712 RepID=UPI0002A65E4C|nr:hypothetical protein [Gordonia sp. YY1]KAF0969464.1 hypothetical protein BPODLACK_01745 [Gordonia sp. YY1]MCZ4654298.1 hypothetical protein [Gordonia amicalis]GAC55701.1 hypothetical protein GOAMI_64_00170 [Gordonia amicalis NBRC 100051 = JCM 11271]
MPGESAADQKQAAEGWRWILLTAAAVAGVLGYTKVWPAAQQFLIRPSPARDYLLPASPDPVYVIAGAGVGWFWVLFIAAPIALATLAALWWAALSLTNRRARSGHMGQKQGCFDDEGPSRRRHPRMPVAPGGVEVWGLVSGTTGFGRSRRRLCSGWGGW